MFGFLALLIVWAVITVIGHVSWLILSLISRAIFRDLEQDSPPRIDKLNLDKLSFTSVLERLLARGMIDPGEFDSLQFKAKQLDAPVVPPHPVVPPVTVSQVVGTPVVGASVSVLAPAWVPEDAPIVAILCDEPQHALLAGEQRSVTIEPTVPAQLRASWSSIITSFLAVHNIRWGELVAGLLIVVCSIGLVISLWNTIASKHRVVPSVLFLTANAAIFAAGFYTLAKWKLRHTSRAVLLIATLLVPLSVLAGLAMASQSGTAVSLADPVIVLVILFGTCVNVLLLYYAGRALLGRPHGPAFALSVAGPASLIPLVPASLRLFAENAGFVTLFASLAVSGAIVWYCRPWRDWNRVRHSLAGASRHLWIVLSVGVYALASHSLALAYLGRALGADLWYSIIVCCIPAIAVVAVASHAASIKSALSSHRFVGVVVSVIASGLLAITLPLLARDPRWLWLWASVSTVSIGLLASIFRRSPWFALATVPLGVATLLSSTSVLQQVDWTSISWPRRILGGEPMLTSLSFLAISGVVCWLLRASEHKRSFTVLTSFWFGTTSLSATALTFAAQDWLGIVPEFLHVGVLVALTLASAVAAIVVGLPALITVVLACMVAMAVTHPLNLIDGFSANSLTRWLYATILASSIIAVLAFVTERLRSLNRLPIGWLAADESRKEPIASWYSASAGFASLAAIVSMFAIPNQSALAIFIAAVSSSILLLCGQRLKDAVWLVASQVALLVTSGAIAKHYLPDLFYTLRSVEPIWCWAFMIALSGIVWLGLQYWSERRWFPCDLPLSEGNSTAFPLCWFLPLSSVLLIIGCVIEVTSLLTERLGSDAMRYSLSDWKSWILPIAALSLSFLSVRVAALVDESHRGLTWRDTLSLVVVAIAVWISTRIVMSLPLDDSHRLILSTTTLLGMLAIAYRLRGRIAFANSQVLVSGGLLMLVAASASLMYHEWALKLNAGLLADRVATVAVAVWWLSISAGLLVSSIKSNQSTHAAISAVLTPLAAGICVPAFVDTHPLVWIQFAAIAAFAWVAAAVFLRSSWKSTGDQSISPIFSTQNAAMFFASAIGILSATVALADPIFGGTRWSVLSNSVGFVLTAITLATLVWRGVDWSFVSLGRSQSRLPLPIAMTLASGQLTWIIVKLAPSWAMSPPSIEFSLLTLASLASLVQSYRSSSRMDALHIMALATIACFAAEWTNVLSPLFALALIAVSGCLVSLRHINFHADRFSELATRLASWFVIGAGGWMFLDFASQPRTIESAWTFFIAWTSLWLITWQLVPLLATRSDESPSQSRDSTRDYPEWALFAVFATFVEIVARSLDVGSVPLTLSSTTYFAIRIVFVALMSVVLWLRADSSKRLAVPVLLGVALFAAVVMHWGTLSEYTGDQINMAAILSSGFVATLLAFTITPLAQLHLIAGRKLGLRNQPSDKRHAMALLVSLLTVSAVAGVASVIMIASDSSLVYIQLTIAAIALCGLGVSEVAERSGNRPVQRAALALGLAAIYLWASVPMPQVQHGLLSGTMRWFVVSVWLIPAMLWGLPRLAGQTWSSRWNESIRQAVMVVAGIGVVSLIAMFGMETVARVDGGIDGLSLPLVVAVAISIGLLSALSAIVALGSGPSLDLGTGKLSVLRLKLSDQQRQFLVVAAQVLGVLTWLHIFLCKRDLALFGLRAYWPYTVLVIAFVSVGIVEWVRRRGDVVIASVLRQTSLYLPLIPVIGLLMSGTWTRPLEQLATGEWTLSLVLIVAAGYYVFLSRMWESWMPRVLLVVFANSAVWSLLAKHPDWSFLQHPQLWLIPPTACVLVLVQWYRRQLDASFVAAVRYGATLVIYVSSTADMLVQQIGVNLWGPVILILLALAGMAAGVLLQIRPFLYLGTLFVLLGVTSMVWHAQRSIDQVWPWWVFGITTGICLLAALMSIEKNKGKLQAISARLATWES